MIDHRIVEVTYAQAEPLADLYGIAMDLRDARRLCEQALKLPDLGSEVLDGLVVAALMKYMRCFSGGSRLGLCESDVKQLSTEQQEAHDFFKNLRDKHVAHPVNPLEETFVTATASEVDGKLLPITSLNPGRESILLHTDDARVVRELAVAMEELVDKRIEEEKARLLAFLQSLPLEDIHKLDLHNPKRHHARYHVRKSRKQATCSTKAIQPTDEDTSG